MAEYVTHEELSGYVKRIEDEDNRQNHRIENLEKDVKEIQKLTLSVERMAVSIDNMAKEISKQGERLGRIESEPAENWKKAIWLIISTLIGAAVGAWIRGVGV